MELYLSVLLGILFGAICSYIANRRGRNPLIWFIVGLLFGIIGLVIILVLPSVKTIDPNKSQKASPSFHEQETNSADDEPEELLTSPLTNEESYQLNPWFYLDKTHAQVGPIDFSLLIQAWQTQEIHPDTYVWTEGMADWQTINQLPDLKAILEEIRN